MGVIKTIEVIALNGIYRLTSAWSFLVMAFLGMATDGVFSSILSSIFGYSI